ncbi:MAG: choice-of-anchor B family protein [Rhodothermales bacterium]|nr:choice-of-anchor B family protein [Rhodothermales bacterium]
MKRSELLRAACLAILFTCTVGVNAQSVTGQRVECVDGMAGAYACSSVDLLSFLSLEDLGSPVFNPDTGGRYPLNDMWGWYDDDSGREFALVGRVDGVSFVDVTDPVNPFLVGTLPAHVTGTRVASTWRDLKVFNDHAFIVADGFAGHGMQVFDLRRLLDVSGDPVEFDEDGHYAGVSSTHNLHINEDTGFAYLVGARGAANCTGPGLHIVDLTSPANPEHEACFSDPEIGRGSDGYLHDVQCVIYDGPDTDHQGRELCFGSGETAVTVTDVTTKTDMFTISTATYPNVSYAHQGWLDEEHTFFYQNDELDELGGLAPATRTLVWDVTDVDDPILVKEYLSVRSNIDHNNYVKDDFLLQSNYSAGLVLLDIAQRDDPVEVGRFDVYPEDDDVNFDGTWSNYPYFRSGAVGVTSRSIGFFMVAPTIAGYQISVGTEEQPRTATLLDVYPNPFTESTTVEFEVDRSQDVRVRMVDMLGRQVAVPFDGPVVAGERTTVDVHAGSLPAGVYVLKFSGEDFVSTTSVVLTR